VPGGRDRRGTGDERDCAQAAVLVDRGGGRRRRSGDQGPDGAACGVPQVGAGRWRAPKGRPGDRGMIVNRVAAAALPDLRPTGRLAGAARPLGRGQGRRTAGAATRGRGPAADQPQAAAELGRPGDPGRVDPTATEDGQGPPAPSGMLARPQPSSWVQRAVINPAAIQSGQSSWSSPSTSLTSIP